MKQYKTVGEIAHVEWDDEIEDYLYWNTEVRRRTAWGWVCFIGREVLYRTHLRRRPKSLEVLNKVLRDVYLKRITESVFQESPLLYRLGADAERRANS